MREFNLNALTEAGSSGEARRDTFGPGPCAATAGSGVADAVRATALGNAGIGIWQIAIDSDELSLDETAAKLLGLDKLSGTGKLASLIELVHPDHRSDFALRLELCGRAGIPTRCSFRLAKERVDIRWLELTANRMRSPLGEPLSCGTLADITKKREVADALEESQSSFATVFEQSMVGVLHNDRNLNVLMVNDRFLELIGRTREELSGLSFTEFTHPDDVKWNAALHAEKRAKGEPFTVEKRYIRPDGSMVWCEVNVSFLFGPDRQWHSSIVFAHDITDRKLAELEQQRANDMLSLALDGAGAGTFEVDLSDDKRVYLSPFAVEIYGLPDDHCGWLTHAEWSALIDPVSFAMFVEEGERFLTSELPHTIEFKIHRPDGAERWLRCHGRAVRDEAGIPQKIVGLVYDDSARRVAEDELRESERGLRLTQEAGRIGTFMLDSDGTAFGSKQYFRNLGLPEDSHSIDHDSWRDMVHPDDLQRFLTEILDAQAAQADFHESEYRITRADNGELRWILARVSPERDADGRPLRLAGVHIDITEAKRAALRLQETESLNHGIIESSPDYIKVLDLDGRLQFMSRRGIQALEATDAASILGMSWRDLWPEETRSLIDEAMDLARAGEVGRFNAGCVTLKGNSRWMDVVVTPLTDHAGRVTQILSITRDITDMRTQAEQVRWTAEHDTLTGLPNRNYFDIQLEQLLIAARTNGEKVGLLALDVDNFKHVNDAFGHDAGDGLLETLSRRIEGMLEPGDFAARLGGDEFAVVVRHLENGRDLLEFGKAIYARLKEPVAHQRFLLDCRVSIGAAASPEHGEMREELLKSADTALYGAKADKQSDVLLFQKSLRSELDRRTAMIGRARAALELDDIVPYYQPKISLKTGHVRGFEALLRWRDPSGAIRLPREVDAAFEDFELAHQLSERMQDRILGDMRRWLDADLDIGHVAINAAAAEFSRNDFAQRLLGKLDAAGVVANTLQVEVTETVFLGRGANHVGDALLALKARGVEIALDDFGTGYASLSHLKNFPVDVIKIDRSFITELGENRGDTAIVCALLGLAGELDMTTVAEGIETEEQAAFLRERNCDFGQGYLYGRAVSATEVPAILALSHFSPASQNRHGRVMPLQCGLGRSRIAARRSPELKLG